MLATKLTSLLHLYSIKSFKSILAGELDDLPESAFYMVGDISDVRTKAEVSIDPSPRLEGFTDHLTISTPGPGKGGRRRSISVSFDCDGKRRFAYVRGRVRAAKEIIGSKHVQLESAEVINTDITSHVQSSRA